MLEHSPSIHLARVPELPASKIVLLFVLLIGCEGDTDTKLYKELLSKGSEKLSNV